MPRAAAMPTRKPVKLPGPTVTAMRSSSEKSRRAAFMTRWISGISASAWPRVIACDFLRNDTASGGVEHGRGAGFERGVDGEETH